MSLITSPLIVKSCSKNTTVEDMLTSAWLTWISPWSWQVWELWHLGWRAATRGFHPAFGLYCKL